MIAAFLLTSIIRIALFSSDQEQAIMGTGSMRGAPCPERSWQARNRKRYQVAKSLIGWKQRISTIMSPAHECQLDYSWSCYCRMPFTLYNCQNPCKWFFFVVRTTRRRRRSSSLIKVSPPSSSSSTTATTHTMDHLFSHVPQNDTIYNVSNPFSMFPSITSQTSMGWLWLAAIVVFQRNGWPTTSQSLDTL